MALVKEVPGADHSGGSDTTGIVQTDYDQQAGQPCVILDAGAAGYSDA